MSSTYRPELDVTPTLTAETSNWYQSQIGVLRWAIELGRYDCITEVSMLSSHSAMPRVGHLCALLRVFAYLSTHTNARVVYDSSYPKIDYSV